MLLLSDARPNQVLRSNNVEISPAFDSPRLSPRLGKFQGLAEGPPLHLHSGSTLWQAAHSIRVPRSAAKHRLRGSRGCKPSRALACGRTRISSVL